jgi:FKBP-type peptidyl-prolyl cis-trans isomerase
MKNNEWITLALGIIIIIFFAWLGGVFTLFKSMATNQPQPMNQNQQATKVPDVSGKNISNDPKLQIIEVQAGTGAAAKTSSHVYVKYTGMLQNGTIFDQGSFDFVLGGGTVIKGWEMGLLGMKAGGKRRLVIAPDYAYGPQDVKNPQTGQVLIPANSTLVFDVELTDVK